MLIDLNNIDLVKGITKTEAKAVHKDLPPGGEWKTIKGHHIYIKDGKILAGSIPGVTKAKKMTKQQMAEHQATMDEVATKGTKKDAKSKSKPVGKASKSAGKKSGNDTKGKDASKAGEGARKPIAKKVTTPKGTANGTKTMGAKADGKSTKPATKSSGTGKPVQPTREAEPTSEGGAKSKPAAEEVNDHYEIYHGTRLYYFDDIKKEGFRLNGTEDDFGRAAYFKSPTFDQYDQDDYRKWIEEKQAQGFNMKMADHKEHGYDTTNVVSGFAGKSNEACVIKAHIPKEHVLDCTKGRPKELQDIITDFNTHRGGSSRVSAIFKHLLGEDLSHLSPDEIAKQYATRKPELEAKLGNKVLASSLSPYEVYAKRHGIGAIVDVLDDYKDEGVQIGVYNPKLIQIKDHGKGIERTDKGVALRKALMKAIALAKAAGYCLLHHHIDEDGLHLYIGALDSSKEMKKALIIDLEKAITKTEAKAIHKDLPPGGAWRTIRGHHIYIKDGKVLAGSIPGVTKAKKATKAQLAEHQATIDAEKKPKKPAKKKPAKKAAPKKTPAKKEPAKKEPAKKAAPKKTPAKQSASKEKTAAKKPKDIRSDAQKNRALAYDVGDKVGGARKDEFIASFKEKPTATSLEELEKMSGAIAEKMVTKANLLPKFDFQQEHDNGVDLPTAILKKLIQDRIAPKPEPSNPETRKAYMMAMSKVQRHFGGIKSFENMRDALRELSVMARQVKAGKDAENAIARYTANPERWSYFNGDSYKERVKIGKEAAKFMDFNALGEKFNNLLTNYESLNRSIDTVRKNTREGWDKYLTPQAKKAPKEKGAENKKWERAAVAEHLRKGGKETKVKKPEDLLKDFNLRGVEFGNWVNDSSGLYHLKRCAEAFDDLSDIIGVDKKDISLNGRLAIAFGARGKGGSLAHYEPDRKVINMTKFGGAGSLAHEWGHAMDNILQQYSNGGQESLGHASEGQMGNSDPKLKVLYDNLMNAIQKPAPGEKGGSMQMILDSSVKQLSRYYPEMRRQIEGGMEPKDVYNHWASKINEQYDRYIASAKNSPYNRTDADKAKAVKKYEQKRSRELTDIGHYIASELRRKQNGGKYGGDHYKGHIEIETGNSEYLQRMLETQPGKSQNGAHYWSQPAELFARVFESYIEDKLKESKRYNNYLVHGTSEGNVKVEGAPFPIGKERRHMFKAMDNLLKYVGSRGALKKALMMELIKSLGYTKRSAYNVANPEDVIYIPVNRLRTVYQTEKATNWDKVKENAVRMLAGENLEPISIGFDYDVHDGHHRLEASRQMGHEHVPCIVKGGNELERQRAIEAYREVWKSFAGATRDEMFRYFKDKLKDGESVDGAYEETITAFDRDYGEEMDFRAYLKQHEYKVQDHFWVNKSLGKEAFEDDERYIYRGVGLRELHFIQKHGYIQSKGKGNDADQANQFTCFSTRYGQAEGYARTNYDLYNERQAFVIALPKPHYMNGLDGEVAIRGQIPAEGMQIIPVPKEDIMKSFNESQHPRDKFGKFTIRGFKGANESYFHDVFMDDDHDIPAVHNYYWGMKHTSQLDKKRELVANLHKFANGHDMTDWFRHYVGQVGGDSQEEKWNKANLNNLYKQAKQTHDFYSKFPKEKRAVEMANMFGDIAKMLAGVTIQAKQLSSYYDRTAERSEHNDKVLKEHGVPRGTVSGWFNNPFKTHDRYWNEGNTLGKRHVETAKYLAKLSENGTKSFSIASKNIRFTFHPTEFADSRDKRMPYLQRFKVDIKTPTSEINGARFVVTRSEQTKSKNGRKLPKHAWQELDQLTVLFDFPKQKKTMQVYKKPGGAHLDAESDQLHPHETWGYKHVEESTEENIRKTGSLILRLLKAHHDQNQ